MPITGTIDPKLAPIAVPIDEPIADFPFYTTDSMGFFPLIQSKMVPTANVATPTITDDFNEDLNTPNAFPVFDIDVIICLLPLPTNVLEA